MGKAFLCGICGTDNGPDRRTCKNYECRHPGPNFESNEEHAKRKQRRAKSAGVDGGSSSSDWQSSCGYSSRSRRTECHPCGEDAPNPVILDGKAAGKGCATKGLAAKAKAKPKTFLNAVQEEAEKYRQAEPYE